MREIESTISIPAVFLSYGWLFFKLERECRLFL